MLKRTSLGQKGLSHTEQSAGCSQIAKNFDIYFPVAIFFLCQKIVIPFARSTRVRCKTFIKHPIPFVSTMYQHNGGEGWCR